MKTNEVNSHDAFMTMVYAFIIYILMVAGCVVANAQPAATKYHIEGNNYVAVKSSRGGNATKTNYTYTDSKGNKYDIYISDSGSCFVNKVSSKTGKEYKYYLGPEISNDICRKLGKEYKGKTSKK